jgi:hypothetical protein
MARVSPPILALPASLQQDKETAKFFDGLMRFIYQIWTEVNGRNFEEKTLTTDNTVTPLQRISVNLNTTVYIEGRVVARRTGGSAGAAGDSAFYVIQGCFKNVSGTVSLVSLTILNGGEDQAGWDCGFAVSGTQAVLVGTGANNNNITWESNVNYYEVGA